MRKIILISALALSLAGCNVAGVLNGASAVTADLCTDNRLAVAAGYVQQIARDGGVPASTVAKTNGLVSKASTICSAANLTTTALSALGSIYAQIQANATRTQ